MGLFDKEETVVAPRSMGGLTAQNAAVGSLEDKGHGLVNLLGSICWWSVYDVRVPYQEYLDVMVDAGIPAEWVAPQNNYKHGMLNAVNFISKDKTWPLSLKKISGGTADGKNPAVYGIVIETIDQAGRKFRAKQVGLIEYNHCYDILDFDWDEEYEVLFDKVEFEAHMKFHINSFVENMHSHEVRQNFLEIVLHNLQGFRVRPSGGIYFVRQEFVHYLDALHEVMEKVSYTAPLRNSERAAGMFQLPIVDAAKERATLMTSYIEHLDSEIGTLVQGLSKAEDDGRKVRTSSVQKRVDQLRELEGKLNAYEGMFESHIEGAQEKVEQARAMLLNHLCAE